MSTTETRATRAWKWECEYLLACGERRVVFRIATHRPFRASLDL